MTSFQYLSSLGWFVFHNGLRLITIVFLAFLAWSFAFLVIHLAWAFTDTLLTALGLFSPAACR